MNMRVWSLAAALVLVLAVPVAWGQDKDNNPPQILTSDLALKTVLEHERVDATFVIVDTDNIVQVTIDGVKQAIKPSDTIEVAHTFDFTKDVTRVEVTATDEHGHTGKVVYTVYKPGVNPATVAGPAGKPKLQWYANYDVRLETDTNPSNDLSSPIKIQGISLTGVVPDSQQTDTRKNILATGGISMGNWSAFVGVSKISYGKSNNTPYDVQQTFLGGIGRLPLSQSTAFRVGYTFTDINLGSHDYSQQHTISPGFRFVTAGKDYTGSTLLGMDLTLKKFASSLQNNTTDETLKWTYNSTSKDRGARYDRVLAVGRSSEGIDVTQYNFLNASWDWRNRWDSGLLFNIGFGLEYRNYPNDQPLSTDTPLGNKRVDIPGRFSFGLGYQFLPQVKLMGRYQYLVNLSNKSPYLRQIYGIGVNGTF